MANFLKTPTTARNSTSVSLINTKIVTGNIANGHSIFYAGPQNSIIVKNFGLFVNKGIDENKVILTIGTGLNNPNYNYQYIADPLLT